MHSPTHRLRRTGVDGPSLRLGPRGSVLVGRASGLRNACQNLAVRCGVGVGTAVASVLAVATVDREGRGGEAVAMQAVVARIAEQIVVTARAAWVGGKMIADDLGIVPVAPSDLVVPTLAADHGR
jgi:hypothetical protein